MPKDLLFVGQRGAAIIDENTPENIKGFFTDDIQTCIALYLVGNDYNKHALLHIDIQTSVDSLRSLIAENFNKIDDYRLFFNAIIMDGTTNNVVEMPQLIALGNLRKIQNLFTFKLDPVKYYKTGKNDWKGSLLINLDRSKKTFSFETDKDFLQLQSRILYDEDFREYRSAIRSIKEIVCRQELPIDLQYDGSNYTKLPTVEKTELLEDLELLEPRNKDRIAAWLLSEETIKKYPHLAKSISKHPEMASSVAEQIIDYFSCEEKYSLTEYKIPSLSHIPNQEKEIADLAASIGEESELTKNRSTDWNLNYSVKLNSKSLKKDVRESIGLDRVKINIPSEEQLEKLLYCLPEIVIEQDKTSSTKALATFALREGNREIIEGIIKPITIPQTAQNPVSQLVETNQKISYGK